MVIDFQIVGKEKELILLDGTAKIAAEVVVSEMPHGGIEIVAGIEIIAPDKFIGSAVVVVGARLQNNVYNGATGMTQLRVVIARRNVYSLDGLERRHQDLQKTGAFVVVDALDLVVVALA